tara:strand:- start:70 stop:318 length:249 start_codon:yes stop_codon:yes gene_type:complete
MEEHNQETLLLLKVASLVVAVVVMMVMVPVLGVECMDRLESILDGIMAVVVVVMNLGMIILEVVAVLRLITVAQVGLEDLVL